MWAEVSRSRGLLSKDCVLTRTTDQFLSETANYAELRVHKTKSVKLVASKEIENLMAGRVHRFFSRKKRAECSQVLEARGRKRERTDSAMFRMTLRQPSAEAVWTQANTGR